MDEMDDETRQELRAWRRSEKEKEAELRIVHWDPATVWEYNQDGSPR